MCKPGVFAFSLCFIFLFVAPSIFATRADDVVTVESGQLRGAMNTDHSVRIFKGVPFAAPPVGELRWRAPQPAKAWTGVRAADKFAPACLQTDVFGDILFRDAQPSEDCLNLNIWIPANAASKDLPVFVCGTTAEVLLRAATPRFDTTERILRRRV